MEKKAKTPSEIHKNHRSRRKTSYLNSGFDSFSDIEKLEFILFYAVSQKDTNPLAHKLIDEFGSFDSVLEAPIEKLIQVDGIGEHSAILLHLFLDVMREYGKSKCKTQINSTSKAKEYCSNLFVGSSVEEFYVICLNSANKVIATKKINTGSVSEVNVEIRKISSIALNTQCASIIVSHNHPNGTAYPSDEDISFTSKIMLSCLMNNIDVLDHIIVADNKRFSFSASNMLKEIKEDVVRKYLINTSKLKNPTVDYIIDD